MGGYESDRSKRHVERRFVPPEQFGTTYPASWVGRVRVKKDGTVCILKGDEVHPVGRIVKFGRGWCVEGDTDPRSLKRLDAVLLILKRAKK